jgi:hypothetical protein
MRHRHTFILCAESEIDSLALAYLLHPPAHEQMWNTVPTPNPAAITVYFPESAGGKPETEAKQRMLAREKVNWVVGGRNEEELDEILLEKSDYLISGVQTEDQIHVPIQNWFRYACEGTKQPVDEPVDISRWRLVNKQAGHSLRARSGQRILHKQKQECRRCGKRHKRWVLCEAVAEDNETRLKERKKGLEREWDGWGWRRPLDGEKEGWENLTAQDMIERFIWEGYRRNGEKREGWASKLPVGDGKGWRTV